MPSGQPVNRREQLDPEVRMVVEIWIGQPGAGGAFDVGVDDYHPT